MKNLFQKNKTQKGYALLFAILIISAISVVTAGLINSIYKQLILSLLARDSTSAFYQADTAVDCAMYADLMKTSEAIEKEYENVDSSEISADVAYDISPFIKNKTFRCGGVDLNIVPLEGEDKGYELLPPADIADSNEPCFRIITTRTPNYTDGNQYDIHIRAKGYNVCDLSSSKAVEREIDVNYTY